jgi:hypothetical protein
LVAARELRRLVAHHEERHVANARAGGEDWDTIGLFLGVRRLWVQGNFAQRIRRRAEPGRYQG